MTVTAHELDPVPVRWSSGKATLVDLFAGCGGLSLGLEMAGFDPLFVNELNPHAMETYLLNRRAKYPHLDANKVHDIVDLTRDEDELSSLGPRLRRDAVALTGSRDVDLLVGGPPCQGYSGIGHRRTFTDLRKIDVPSNHLYEQMARVIEAVRPKMFLFENVRGLKVGKWTPDGAPGEIWRDVLERFANIQGYDVRPADVLAKHYGVPQNRPRVLIVGIRRDLGWRAVPGQPAEGLIPVGAGMPPDPAEFLGDLVDPTYPETLETTNYPAAARSEIQRWYRTNPETGVVAGAGDPVTEHEYSRHRQHIVAKFKWMLEHGGEIRESDQTKKFAQRVIPTHWDPRTGPTITATSLADDYVHFSQPRVLTVREWARMQTFPDWYKFAGKRTTGGRRRAGDPDAGNWTREVPKYTQIGNAVPVRLAHALGNHFAEFLR